MNYIRLSVINEPKTDQADHDPRDLVPCDSFMVKQKADYYQGNCKKRTLNDRGCAHRPACFISVYKTDFQSDKYEAKCKRDPVEFAVFMNDFAQI